jgi:hypothetical protein
MSVPTCLCAALTVTVILRRSRRGEGKMEVSKTEPTEIRI